VKLAFFSARAASAACCWAALFVPAPLNARLIPRLPQSARAHSSRRAGEIAIVGFPRSYLRYNRQVLVIGRRAHPYGSRSPRRSSTSGRLLMVLGTAMADAFSDSSTPAPADVLRRLPGRSLRRHQPASRSLSSAWRRCSPSARACCLPRCAPNDPAAPWTPGCPPSGPLYDKSAQLQIAQSSRSVSPRPTSGSSARLRPGRDRRIPAGGNLHDDRTIDPRRTPVFFLLLDS